MTTGTQFPDWQATGGGGGGVVTSVSYPLQLIGGDLSIPAAGAVTDGYLTAADWVRFNAAAIAGGYTVNTFTLLAGDITNQYVTLSSAPVHPTLTVLNIVTGGVQSYATDFIVVGSQLRWIGLALAGFLVTGNKLVVQFY